MNLPLINAPVPGQASSQAQNGANKVTVEAPSTQMKGSGNGTSNDLAADVAQGMTDVANQPQIYQDSSVLHHFRDMQRRQVEFIKKRVLLLEKGLNAEYQKEYFRVSCYCLFKYQFNGTSLCSLLIIMCIKPFAVIPWGKI